MDKLKKRGNSLFCVYIIKALLKLKKIKKKEAKEC